MTNFKHKKLSQIEEEEEAISNLEGVGKSSWQQREKEMNTGINNNLKYTQGFNTNFNLKKKKSSVPLLKTRFKTAYQGNLESFLTNGYTNLMKNMDTMQVNGKNFHLFQTKKHDEFISLVNKKNKMNEEYTAEDGIMDHIREESIQRNTLQSGNSKKNPSFQNFRLSEKPRKSRKNQFYTGGIFGLNPNSNNQIFSFGNQRENSPNTYKNFFTPP